METLEDAYCESLRRTAIGDLQVPDGDSVEVSVEELTRFLPERLLNADEADRVANGRPVSEPFDVPPAHVRLTYDGRLLAVARVDGENLRPEVVLK